MTTRLNCERSPGRFSIDEHITTAGVWRGLFGDGTAEVYVAVDPAAALGDFSAVDPRDLPKTHAKLGEVLGDSATAARTFSRLLLYTDLRADDLRAVWWGAGVVPAKMGIGDVLVVDDRDDPAGERRLAMVLEDCASTGRDPLDPKFVVRCIGSANRRSGSRPRE